MSTQTIRILIAGALFVHGIGHTLGFWKPVRNIPFTKITGAHLKLVGGIIWVLVALGFVISAMGFYGILVPTSWWRMTAIVFAALSLIGLLFFGRNWPLFNIIGAAAMDIATLVALLWLNWPPFAMFGR